MHNLQLFNLHERYDLLQQEYGAKELSSIYGAGDINNTKYLFVFMNPTARNIASDYKWDGIRAQWLGTKIVWDLFAEIGIVPNSIHKEIRKMKPQDWTPEFSLDLYKEIARNNAFITNLAKCTQVDARPLSNLVFKEYLDLMIKEVKLLNNPKVILFGNQVSSIVLQKNLSVSNYKEDEFEMVEGEDINARFYPTYYPVGQGRRNMPISISRLKRLMR